MFFLCIAHVPDEVCFDTPGSWTEALVESVSSSWSRDHEVHLIEVDHCGVVDVDEKLIGQEVAHPWIAAQQLECASPSTRISGACVRSPLQHLLQQQQMIACFRGAPNFGEE